MNKQIMELNEGNPNHICIIMDGDGRWASMRGLSRTEGHKSGVDSVRKIIKHCNTINIKYLTLFTFSQENWSRPKQEVLSLMKLLIFSLNSELKSMIENNIKFQVIGDLEKLDLITKNSLQKAEASTSGNTGLNLCLAISYGGRQEIINAINKIIHSKKKYINDKDFSQFLYTKNIPDPDLLIRTGDEHRISNFLLWQMAYTEIYFSKVFWPDFSEEDLDCAIEDFKLRERRFGKLV